MGILPLEFAEGVTAESLGLTGRETFDISGVSEGLSPFKKIKVKATKESGETIEFETKARLDSAIDVAYYENGGILQYVLRGFLK